MKPHLAILALFAFIVPFLSGCTDEIGNQYFEFIQANIRPHFYLEAPYPNPF